MDEECINCTLGNTLMTARDELADDLHALEVASKDAAGKAAIIGIDIEFLAKVVKAQADP